MVQNIATVINETVTEVVVHPLMWKEGIIKTKATLVVTPTVARLRSSKTEEQRTDILYMAVENTSDIVIRTEETV